MNVTTELKASLTALCQLLECAGTPPGLASPELFRLAKQDSADAVKPMMQICACLLDTDDLAGSLRQLHLAAPLSWRSSKSLLLICSILLHRLNFAEQLFYSATATTHLLRHVAAGAEIKSDLIGADTSIEANGVVLVNRIRLVVNSLKMWQPPSLPEQVDYMSAEEFVIAQSPAKMTRLVDEVKRRVKVINAYVEWVEKESFFWSWITPQFDASLFEQLEPAASASLSSKARVQLTRIDKMNGVFAKLPKPKFKPDRMRARAQLTQALLGMIQQLGTAPPGSAKMAGEIDELKRANVAKLNALVKSSDALVTFP